MSTNTTIEWTDVTWNPVRGCSLVSEGCRRCYAMKQAHRFSGKSKPYEGLTELGPDGPRWTGKIRTVPELLEEPLRWRTPRRIFVNSMSDLFHESVPEPFIDQVLCVAAMSPLHTFQILTKRPQRMLNYLADPTRTSAISNCLPDFIGPTISTHDTVERWCREHQVSRKWRDGLRDTVTDNGGFFFVKSRWPLPNVWLGVSVEDQKTADERIPLLLQTPAAIRFVSCEPALGPVDFSKWLNAQFMVSGAKKPMSSETAQALQQMARAAFKHAGGELLDWIIAGGESGPHARPAHPDWFRSVRDQCQAAGVPFFFKQWGEWLPVATPRMNVKIGDRLLIKPDGTTAPATWSDVMSTTGDLWGVERVGKKTAGRHLDGREWSEFPEVRNASV